MSEYTSEKSQFPVYVYGFKDANMNSILDLP